MKKRVLGIDIGLKRTGLAVSDDLGLTVRPLENRIPKSRNQDAEFIVQLVKELGVEVIVLGYPTGTADKESPIAKRASGFKDIIEEKFSSLGLAVKVYLIDETFSSKLALQRLIQSGIKKSKRKALVDSEVARILVEEFLMSKDLISK